MYSSFFLKKFLLISIVIPIFNILAVSAAFNASEICALISNGTQIKDPTACNKWIECVNLEPISNTCDTGLFYDRNKRDCVPENSIKCISSNPCAELTNSTSGFVPDPYSCSTYYYCSNDVPSKGSCNTNWTYNPSTKTCILGGNCTSTMDPDSYCNIVPDGIFIGIADNCESYQECWDGTLINGTCPETYYFNAFNGICVDNVDACHTSSNTTAMEPVTECMEAGQFISDNSTCNGYYYCKLTRDNQYTLIHGSCSTGYFYDQSIKDGECVIRTEIVCQYDRCAGMGLEKIQLSNLSDDGCKGYAVCQYGQTIGTGVCPHDEYFDEVAQLCTIKVVSYPACTLSSNSTSTQTPLVTTTSKNTVAL